jgi:hypothetical protein
MCRAYVDVLAQALNLKIDWVVPTKKPDETPEPLPEQQSDKTKGKKGKSL